MIKVSMIAKCLWFGLGLCLPISVALADDAPIGNCRLLAFQESRLSALQANELQKFGILKLGSNQPVYKKHRIPMFAVSKDLVSDCKRRLMVSQHFDNVILHGPRYYEKDHHVPEIDPRPFGIKSDFVLENADLITELIYRFLSPNYHDYINRSGTSVGFDLLQDDRIATRLEAVKKRLEEDGLSTRYP